MSEATDAILDIKEALQEFGTDIIFQKITPGTYSPAGTTTTKVETNTKALIKKQASQRVENAFAYLSKIEGVSSSYEVVFTIYLPFEPTKKDKIVYKGLAYTILYVDSTVLQNETLKYEILARR